MRYRIGIDVGGTNTDAVLLDGRRVVAWTKQPTTPDVTSGVASALERILAETEIAPSQVGGVMLGTTQFTNAVIQRRGLARTAALRLCLPAGEALPPFTDWPDEMREAVTGSSHLLHGGFEFDGRPISLLDEAEIGAVVAALRAAGVEAVAICGIFSPVDSAQEVRAAELLARLAPEIEITLSHEIGRLGLLERENAALLNACLSRVAGAVVGRLGATVAAAGLRCPLYLSLNDGTLIGAGYAARYPVFTFASGPTNSMRGAARLSGARDGVVIDVGGTSADFGALVSGFPREASFEVSVGGVRTNFRMPDIVSLALGGGSIVTDDGGRVGPTSVGYELVTRGRVFGGPVLTATDIAVAAGLSAIGDPAGVRDLDAQTVARALQVIRGQLEAAVDGLRTSADPVPVVVVGGGSFLVPNDLAGAASVERPEYCQVANAIGAALGQVGGEVDRVFAVEGRSRTEILAAARAEAEARAVTAGADPGTLEVVEVDEIPLAYLPSNVVRVRVKVVGDLKA
ncbi:MAG: hydantoinase/oxoprolinase N-terminal domain-containing protein [Dehalococcoidia bacterium]